jgi:hypothetical protein
VSLADIPCEKLAVKRLQNLSRVLDGLGRQFKKGKLPLLFIEADVKINQDYYIEHVLENLLFEHAKKICMEKIFSKTLRPHKAKNC